MQGTERRYDPVQTGRMSLLLRSVAVLDSVVRGASTILQSAVGALLWLALQLERLRRRLPRLQRRLRRSLQRLLDEYGDGSPAVAVAAGARPWNRTTVHLEERLVRLHVEQPLLGTGQLRHLAARVLGFTGARETVRRILIHNQHLVVELQQARRKRRQRIRVERAGELWGIDPSTGLRTGFTLV